MNPMRHNSHCILSYRLLTVVQLTMAVCIVTQLFRIFFTIQRSSFERDSKLYRIYYQIMIKTQSDISDIVFLIQFQEFSAMVYLIKNQQNRRPEEIYRDYNIENPKKKQDKETVPRELKGRGYKKNDLCMSMLFNFWLGFIITF
mmetsp:Transcript_17737/g.30034  ORF Transcript_17737/g.30034 Transcript_17737/m.30034 type:complete len:144 (+) Transcript_17737:162-593(+)